MDDPFKGTLEQVIWNRLLGTLLYECVKELVSNVSLERERFISSAAVEDLELLYFDRSLVYVK